MVASKLLPAHVVPLLDGLFEGQIPLQLAFALWRHDAPTFLHGLRVARMTLHLADALRVEEADRDQAVLGAFLHDIGKLRVDTALLAKPAAFSRGEYQAMQTHAVQGHVLLCEAGRNRLGGIALAHHERWDGRGYPHGLKGNQIPFAAQITSVADAFDAMTHDRPYRRALPAEAALLELRQGRGTQFAPEVVDGFCGLQEGALALAG